MTLYEFLDKLEKVKPRRGGHFSARCPYHGDKVSSLSIKQDDDKILIHCFAKCDKKDILNSIGLNLSDLFIDEESNEELKGKYTRMTESTKMKIEKYENIDEILSLYPTLEKLHKYNKLGEDTSLIQLRYLIKGNKCFSTYHKTEDGHWEIGKGTTDELTPLYNIDEVNEANSILIVEGETCVDVLKEYGIVATTSIGGASNANGSDWSILKNKPSVVIWRDNDEPGSKFQEDILEILFDNDVSARVVNVENLGLNEKDDIVDFIELHKDKSKKDIKKLIYSCIPKLEDVKIEPVTFLKKHLDKVRKGELKNFEIPGFPLLTEYGQLFQPHNQLILYSDPGVGKTLFSGRFADEWTLSGEVRTKRLLLESPMSFHLTRSLGQLSEDTRVLKTRFHYDNPKLSEEIVDKYSKELNIIGETLTTSDMKKGRGITEWDEKKVIKWIEDNAKDNDVLVIDPVSRILDENPWRTSNYLTSHAEEIISRNPHLIILWIHHPNAENTISGGMAWRRFVSGIMKINQWEEPKLYEIETSNGDIITKSVDKYIKIEKCRSGEGMGYKIAIELNKKNLCFKEIGKMLKEIK